MDGKPLLANFERIKGKRPINQSERADHSLVTILKELMIQSLQIKQKKK